MFNIRDQSNGKYLQMFLLVHSVLVFTSRASSYFYFVKANYLWLNIYILNYINQQISWTAVQLPASPCGGQFSKNLKKSSSSQKILKFTKISNYPQIHKKSSNSQDSKLMNSQKNIPKEIQKSQKDPQIHKKISKFPRFKIGKFLVSKFTKISPNSQKYPQIHKKIPKFPKISPNLQKDPQTHNRSPNHTADNPYSFTKKIQDPKFPKQITKFTKRSKNPKRTLKFKKDPQIQKKIPKFIKRSPNSKNKSPNSRKDLKIPK